MLSDSSEDVQNPLKFCDKPEAKIYNSLLRRLDNFRGRDSVNCLIFVHRQADPDALCSAGALKLLLETSFSHSKLDIKIVAPQGASVLGKQVAATLGIEYLEEIDSKSLIDPELIIVADTGDPKLLEPYTQAFSESSATKILIDHHGSSLFGSSWTAIDEKFVDNSCTSTCEIVALGFPANVISRQIAQILLPGVLFDSQHLGIATKKTLEAALVLVNSGAEISSAKRILRHEPDRSEVLGRIKAAQRLRYEEVDGYVIAMSEISSYHASVARMLVDIGSDIGVAYGESGGEARLSARSSQLFYRETEIDLALQIKKISDYFELVGGGHSTAASLSGKFEHPKVLAERLIQNIRSAILQK